MTTTNDIIDYFVDMANWDDNFRLAFILGGVMWLMGVGALSHVFFFRMSNLQTEGSNELNRFVDHYEEVYQEKMEKKEQSEVKETYKDKIMKHPSIHSEG